MSSPFVLTLLCSIVAVALLCPVDAGSDTREEQWADDMALSDDDSAFRTADELEMLNNKLRSLRELLELETRGVQTEIEKLLSGFKDVKLTGNGDIPTKPFLDACRRMVPFYDLLGETAFAPVKSDINGNILKLTKKYSTDPDRYSTLQDIVKQEMAEKTTKAKNSATDALLWLRRALEFHQHFLAGIAEGETDLVKVAKAAYEGSLKKYHGWMVQGIFSLAMKAVPYYDDFVRTFASGSKDAMIRNAKIYSDTLGILIKTLQDFYTTYNLDSKKKV
ncbi:glycolipid transfer protein-like isoform X1 [Branchiostoma floridae x Branchiostoma japonicum]